MNGPCEVPHRHNDTCRLMHVHILDHSGNLLADVDARSTSDALAYYLNARRIEPGATEARVRMAASPDPCNPIGDRVPIVRTTREFSAASASGWVERDITAQVSEGSAPC